MTQKVKNEVTYFCEAHSDLCVIMRYTNKFALITCRPTGTEEENNHWVCFLVSYDTQVS